MTALLAAGVAAAAWAAYTDAREMLIHDLAWVALLVLGLAFRSWECGDWRVAAWTLAGAGLVAEGLWILGIAAAKMLPGGEKRALGDADPLLMLGLATWLGGRFPVHIPAHGMASQVLSASLTAAAGAALTVAAGMAALARTSRMPGSMPLGTGLVAAWGGALVLERFLNP